MRLPAFKKVNTADEAIPAMDARADKAECLGLSRTASRT
jgi:hypothetical protein